MVQVCPLCGAVGLEIADFVEHFMLMHFDHGYGTGSDASNGSSSSEEQSSTTTDSGPYSRDSGNSSLTYSNSTEADDDDDDDDDSDNAADNADAAEVPQAGQAEVHSDSDSFDVVSLSSSSNNSVILIEADNDDNAEVHEAANDNPQVHSDSDSFDVVSLSSSSTEIDDDPLQMCLNKIQFAEEDFE